MIMFFGAPLFLFLSLVYGQTVTPPAGGTLQCQCTCTSAGLPNTNIYTSGNMNIVEKPTVTDIPPPDPKANEKVVSSSVTVPKVDGTNIPIDKKVTQFKDVAVSMIRNSLGSGPDGKGIKRPEKRTMEASPPKINWQHSASSKAAIEEQKQQQTLNVATKPLPLYQEGNSFGNTETTINEEVNEDPILPKSSADVTKTSGLSNIDKVASNQNVNNEQIKSSLNNPSTGATITITDKISVDRNVATGALSGFSNRVLSNSNSDKVAADIGFVLDGSAPQPILSAVMSGYGGRSLGSGFIVEDIKSKPKSGYFVDKNSNKNSDPPKLLSSLTNPSVAAVQKSGNSSPATTTKAANQGQTGNQMLINENKNGAAGPKYDNKSSTNKNNNMKITIDNNKQGTSNNNNKPTSNNRGQNNAKRWNTNSNDKPKSQMNNRNRPNNNNNNSNNNKNNNNNNNNNNNWRNKNKQNNNRNVWRKEQMKPFNILQDQKQNMGWNNNGQWGNWGTTTVSYAMMGMDPLLFLGQHQL